MSDDCARATMEANAPLPAPVPENCPGTASEAAGKAAACAGCPNQVRSLQRRPAEWRLKARRETQAACASAPKGPDPELEDIMERMRHIKHKASAKRPAVSLAHKTECGDVCRFSCFLARAALAKAPFPHSLRSH